MFVECILYVLKNEMLRVLSDFEKGSKGTPLGFLRISLQFSISDSINEFRPNNASV